jgi:hypothetical protein
LAQSVSDRINGFDWESVPGRLDAEGNAVIRNLLLPEECRDIALLYPIDDLFRSRVVMTRHGFGRGEYKYFRYPLPDLIAELRTFVYPRLVPPANRWNQAMGIETRYPEKHSEFRALPRRGPDSSHAPAAAIWSGRL